MTLIEILLQYAGHVNLEGRRAANKFLRVSCEEILWKHIEDSVDGEGNFIDSEGIILDL